MLKAGVVLLSLLLLVGLALGSKKGILELDEISWDRVVDGSKPVLVAFTEYSWKDPDDYDKVSEEFKENNVLVAKVDGSNNKELKERFGVTEFPTFKFFPQGGKDKPLDYKGSASAPELIDFVRLQQNPKLKELKEFAIEFTADASKRSDLLKKAESLVNGLEGSDKEYGKFFVASMKKINEKGEEFIDNEKERLSGLIENKATAEAKKKEFNKRLNILNAFTKEIA